MQAYGRKLKKSAQLYLAVAGIHPSSFRPMLCSCFSLSFVCGCGDTVVLAYRDQNGRLPCEAGDAKQVRRWIRVHSCVPQCCLFWCQLLALRDSMVKAQGIPADSVPDQLLE